jgi:hypothetical protein
MNIFDLFEDDMDPENEGVEKLRFHLKKNRFKSIAKPALHRGHRHGVDEQEVEETASMTKGMKSNHDAFKMQEARKPDVNFDIEDIKRLEQIKDIATLKTQAMNLISKPSAKPMRPEKVEWFRSALERMDSPMKVIKLMYDLMLSGEGHQVIGSRRSMNPNSYRSRFGEQSVAKGSPNFLDDDFYAYDPETMEIKDTWGYKSVGRRHSEYRAQQEGWSVVSGMRARSLGLHYPTNNEAKQRLDPKCWTGYKKQGTKMKGGVRVNNCVPAESIEEENKGLYYNVNKRKKAGISRDKNHPKAPTAQAWKDAAKTAKKNESIVSRQMMEALEEYLYELELAGYEIINEKRTRP